MQYFSIAIILCVVISVTYGVLLPAAVLSPVNDAAVNVVTLNFAGNVLATGSDDGTIVLYSYVDRIDRFHVVETVVTPGL